MALWVCVRAWGRAERAVVVVDATRALLFFGKGRVEVVVEVTVQRWCPRKCPAHAALVILQRGDRGTWDCDHSDVTVFEMRGKAVEAVRDRRTRRAASWRDRRGTPDPRQSRNGTPYRFEPTEPCRHYASSSLRRVAPSRPWAAPPSRKPLLTCSYLVVSHCFSRSCRRKRSVS